MGECTGPPDVRLKRSSLIVRFLFVSILFQGCVIVFAVVVVVVVVVVAVVVVSFLVLRKALAARKSHRHHHLTQVIGPEYWSKFSRSVVEHLGSVGVVGSS